MFSFKNFIHHVYVNFSIIILSRRIDISHIFSKNYRWNSWSLPLTNWIGRKWASEKRNIRSRYLTFDVHPTFLWNSGSMYERNRLKSEKPPIERLSSLSIPSPLRLQSATFAAIIHAVPLRALNCVTRDPPFTFPEGFQSRPATAAPRFRARDRSHSPDSGNVDLIEPQVATV